MSQLFATALMLTLSAGSAGLLTASNQPPLAQPFDPGSRPSGVLRWGAAEPALAPYLAQATLPMPSTLVPQTEEAMIALPKQLEAPVEAITADICLNLPNWQRPAEAAQIKQLQAMPNYGTALQAAPLADLAKDWWSHDIFSFTTYGLSARTDPLYLSGVWTALDDIWNCYSGDQPEQINQGELAEVWLLNHRFVGLEWQDGQYLVTVEPMEAGLQLVQFPRRESGQGLPLSIVTITGQPLAVMSGDW